jgi:hypothetical protein
VEDVGVPDSGSIYVVRASLPVRFEVRSVLKNDKKNLSTRQTRFC